MCVYTCIHMNTPISTVIFTCKYVFTYTYLCSICIYTYGYIYIINTSVEVYISLHKYIKTFSCMHACVKGHTCLYIFILNDRNIVRICLYYYISI